MNQLKSTLFGMVFAGSFLRPQMVGAAAGDVDTGFTGSADGAVYSTAVQRDGKMVIGGGFSTAGAGLRNFIARLDGNGTLDSGFNPGTDGDVVTTAVQKNGQILIGGGFTMAGGVGRNNIARINPSGSLDTGFNPDVDNQVYCIVIQTDGKIIVGGNFSMAGGAFRNGIARLNNDGTVDPSFNPDVEGSVYCVLIQDDGGIILGGQFAAVSGSERNNIARLSPGGVLDPAFNPNLSGRVFCMALEANGSVLIGGGFTLVGDEFRNRLARLNPNGTLDLNFNPDLDEPVRSLTLQADGKMILGGYFTSVGSISRNNLARVNPNGTVDLPFNPNADERVWSTSLQADGKIVVGGDFTTIGGTAHNFLVRLENDPATQRLRAPTTSRIEWLRGGTSPEVSQVTFELSTDGGSTWSPLGSGTRIAGGWERTGLSLPANGHIRALGRVSGGQYSSSSGFVETVAVMPEPPLLTPVEIWRETHFGDPDNAGPGADSADPDKDGIENLAEFAFGLHPLQGSAGLLPVWQRAGNNFILHFTRAPGLGQVTLIAEQSPSMKDGTWTTIPNTGTPPDYAFSVSAADKSRMFLRVRVTSP